MKSKPTTLHIVLTALIDNETRCKAQISRLNLECAFAAVKRVALREVHELDAGNLGINRVLEALSQ